MRSVAGTSSPCGGRFASCCRATWAWRPRCSRPSWVTSSPRRVRSRGRRSPRWSPGSRSTPSKPRNQNGKQSERQVLIDEGLHATVPSNRRSRSAANTKQARTSSISSSGKSQTISASVMPEARYSRMSVTVIRSPRTHGLPLRLPGSTVIRFKNLRRHRGFAEKPHDERPRSAAPPSAPNQSGRQDLNLRPLDPQPVLWGQGGTLEIP